MSFSTFNAPTSQFDGKSHSLKNALEQLGPLDQEIIRLRHFAELSNDAAARALHIAPATASKLYRSALTKLRDKLKSSTMRFEPFSVSSSHVASFSEAFSSS